MYVERASRVPGAIVWSSTSDNGEKRVLPDGCMDLIWRDGEVVVAGPDTRAHVFNGRTWMDTIGLRFAPGFGPRVIGVPAREFADRRIPLAEVWSSRDSQRLLEQLSEADDVGAALEHLVFERCDAPDPDMALIDHVVRRARNGDAVNDIADAVGFSTRQLQRLCNDAFGYGAKTLTRILRLVRALELARSGTAFAETAVQTGYADQAHLSRDVKELAGVTLGQLVAPSGNGEYRSTELPSGSSTTA